jgi:hypothetical protein
MGWTILILFKVPVPAGVLLNIAAGVWLLLRNFYSFESDS